MEYIEHDGIVVEVAADNISVNIRDTSGCSDCNVKGLCSVSDGGEKTIHIHNGGIRSIKKGDRVIINYEKSMGPRALLLGYILPFFLVVGALIISLAITHNEGLAGILSLFVLVPYYLSLYFFKNKLKDKFAFNIKSVNT